MDTSNRVVNLDNDWIMIDGAAFRKLHISAVIACLEQRQQGTEWCVKIEGMFPNSHLIPTGRFDAAWELQKQILENL